MTEIDIVDGTPLFEKIMAHFGWYKAKKVDLQVEKMESNYTFIIKDDTAPEGQWQFPVDKSNLKKPISPATKAIWDKNFKADDVAKALDKQAPKPKRKPIFPIDAPIPGVIHKPKRKRNGN
jgi:hypothetical protein